MICRIFNSLILLRAFVSLYVYQLTTSISFTILKVMTLISDLMEYVCPVHSTCTGQGGVMSSQVFIVVQGSGTSITKCENSLGRGIFDKRLLKSVLALEGTRVLAMPYGI